MSTLAGCFDSGCTGFGFRAGRAVVAFLLARVATASSGTAAGLCATLVFCNAWTAMACFETDVLTTAERLFTGSATARRFTVAGYVLELSLTAETVASDQRRTRRTGLVIGVAVVVQEADMATRVRTHARIGAGRHLGTATHRRLQTGATTVASNFIKGGLETGKAFALVAGVLTAVVATR